EFGDLAGVDPQMLRALQEFMDARMAAQTDARVRITLDALSRIGRSLAGYPGRKNLVWLSGAFSQAVTSSVTGAVSVAYGGLLRHTANELSDAQIAIYPVDARGLVVIEASDISLPARPMSGAQLNAELSRRAEGLDNAHSSMNTLADLTGGIAVYN